MRLNSVIVTILLWTVSMGSMAESTNACPMDSQRRSLDGVPSHLQNLVVYDHRDLDDVVAGIAPNDATELRFQIKRPSGVSEDTEGYLYRQWIHDVATLNVLWFEVDTESKTLVDLKGAILDRTDIPTEPAISREVALETTIAYLRDEGERVRWRLHHAAIIYDGFHDAIKLLKDCEVWWAVGIDIEDRPYPSEPHEWYWVSPQGEVEPWQETVCSHC